MVAFPSPTDALHGMRSFVRPSFGRRAETPHQPPIAPPQGLGATFDKMMELPTWAGDFIRFLGHGSMAFVGIYMGADKSGFLSTVGWVVGIMSGFAALLDVCGIITAMFGDARL